MGLLRKFLNQTRKPEGFLGNLMLSGMSFGHAKIADWAMSMLNIPEPAEIVELGCGNGRDAGKLLKKYTFSNLTAIDYSPLSVEKTRKNNKKMIAAGRMTVQEGNVSDLKLEPGKFDLATAFETIYFWPDLKKCFAEVHKVLKTSGHFMIVMESDGRDKTIQWFKEKIDGMNTYTPEEIKEALEYVGFSEIKIYNKLRFNNWTMVLAKKI